MKQTYQKPETTTETMYLEGLLYTASPGIGGDFAKRHTLVGEDIVWDDEWLEEDEEEEMNFWNYQKRKDGDHW